jgi:peroxiredoxin Q/BCP
LASYARGYDRFQELGISVVGVSVDDTTRNRAMVEKLVLPFPLLADPEGRVVAEWGVYDEQQRIAVPSIFLVRPDSTIAYRYVGDDFADRPGDEEIFAALGGGADGAG